MTTLLATIPPACLSLGRCSLRPFSKELFFVMLNSFQHLNNILLEREKTTDYLFNDGERVFSFCPFLLCSATEAGRHTLFAPNEKKGGNMARQIGIRHRIKLTAAGEPRPTEVYISDLNGKKPAKYTLATETDELDFLLDRFPTKMRPVEKDDDVSVFLSHQVKWRELKKDEDWTAPEHQRRTVGKSRFEAMAVPVSFDGYKPSDVALMALGGSGDRFAFALSRRGEEINAVVKRVNARILKEEREERGFDNDDDAQLLVKIAQEKPALFYQVRRRDRDLIAVREILFDRVATMRERIAAQQRLRQRCIGRVFINEDARYPEGDLEEQFDAVRANDVILTNLTDEEEKRKIELEKALAEIAVYQMIFQTVEGIGPLTAAPIIAAIGDVTRFPGEAQFKAYCGVHVQLDGTFPRSRRDYGAKSSAPASAPEDDEEITEETLAAEVEKVAEETKQRRGPQWNRAVRQAFYLIGDQFNRRPNTVWGIKLREYKLKFRTAHPDVMCKKCGKVFSSECKKARHKTMYTDGHIHKMGIWRTVTKFAEWLYKEWYALETRLKEQSE